MIFRQLFEPESSTYTYLIADDLTKHAIFVDPVVSMHERDMEQLISLGLTLTHLLETHVHADHVTGAALLATRTGARIAVAKASGVSGDVKLEDGGRLHLGDIVIEVRSTPGHTSGCTTYVIESEGLALTGDALLIRGCGRTDFQDGDARVLYRSVRERIFTLPFATRLYPGHDYRGRMVTTVEEERRLNARLRDGISEDEFAKIMASLKLAKPKMIEIAVPWNMKSGAGYVETKPGQWQLKPGEGEGGDGI